MNHDWYRCSKWSDEEQTLFFQKIRRSKGNFHRAQLIDKISNVLDGYLDKLH
jgi:hypothetical protein